MIRHDDASVSETLRTQNDGGRVFTRRSLLAAAGGAALAGPLTACNGSQPTSSSGPFHGHRAGRQLPAGRDRGSSADLMDAQAIVSKPDQARLMTAFETLLECDENSCCAETGLAERVTQDSPTQWTIELRRGSSSTTARRSRPRTSSTRCGASIEPKEGLFGRGGPSAIDPEGIRDDRRYGEAAAGTPDSTIADQLGQYYNGMVPVGYRRRAALKWSAPAHTSRAASARPAERARANRQLLAAPAAVLRPGHGHRLLRRDGAGQRAPLEPGRCDDGHAVRPDRRRRASSGLRILVSQTRRLAAAVHGHRPARRSPTTASARRCGCWSTAARWSSRCSSGYGTVANDLFSPFDPSFDTSSPQRERDVGKAQVAAQGGRRSGAVDLHTTNAAAGHGRHWQRCSRARRTRPRGDHRQRAQRSQLLRHTST